jgi:small-conductance mechanosensitive channel
MDILNQTLFRMGDSNITFLSLIIFFIILIFTIIISVGLKNLLNKKIFPRYQISPGISKSYSRIIYYVVFVTGLLLALNSAGINISVLFAGGAALLVGIGFGVRNIVNNFISGIILLFERPIKEGDFIEVDGMPGTVVSISARSTKIRTNSNIMIFVPNSKFLENNIINRSYNKNMEMDIPVNISYNSDIDKVTEILLKTAYNHPKVLKEPKPSVSVSELAESYIKLKLFVHIYKPRLFTTIKADLNLAIVNEFKKSGYEFPAPKYEIRLNKD